MIQKDILGTEPSIGDTIVYNPPRKKGLIHGICVGFSKSGLPKIEYDENKKVRGQVSIDNCLTPKTGFVVIKK